MSTTVASVQERPDEELRSLLIKAVNESNSFEDRFVAEVWLTDMSGRLEKRIKEHDRRLEMLKTIHHESRRADLPPELVLAVIEVESNFNRFAISRVGARGLMQIMPFWLKEIGRPDDNLFNIQTNLRFGCTILKHYLDREKGNLRKALARYNGSTGKRNYPDKVFNALSKRWFRQ
jgi:soluble lytic murein transglycosylase-like protein